MEERCTQNAKCGAHNDSSTLTREPKVPEAFEMLAGGPPLDLLQVEHGVHFLNLLNCGAAHPYPQEALQLFRTLRSPDEQGAGKMKAVSELQCCKTPSGVESLRFCRLKGPPKRRHSAGQAPQNGSGSLAVLPPSSVMTSPVRKPALSPARKTARSPTSRGLPTRPTGCSLFKASRASAGAGWEAR